MEKAVAAFGGITAVLYLVAIRAYPSARAQLRVAWRSDRPLGDGSPQSTARELPAVRRRAGCARGLRRRAVSHHQARARASDGWLAMASVASVVAGAGIFGAGTAHVHGRRLPTGHGSRCRAGVLGRRLAGLQLRGLRVRRLDRDRRRGRAQAPSAAAMDGVDRGPDGTDQLRRSVRGQGGNRSVLAAGLVRAGRRPHLRRVAPRPLDGGLAVWPAPAY